MSEAVASVDVRDMLCAQALARIAKALSALDVGQRVRVRFNAEDVERDIVSWVAARGHKVEGEEAETLWIKRQR